MKVFLSSARTGKEKLKEAFKSSGAELVGALDRDVKLVVPTMDEELQAFACMKDYLKGQGVTVAVSSEYTIQMCRDKAEFYRFCRRHDFRAPITAQFEAIIKPRFGKGSRGQFKVDRSYICQEIIAAPEYSIDYFKDGDTLSIIPRLRMNVVNGESQGGKIVMDEKLIDESKRMGEELGLGFHNVMQCFYDGKEITWCEVNPRYGGGSWLTFEQFNSPEYLVEHYGK